MFRSVLCGIVVAIKALTPALIDDDDPDTREAKKELSNQRQFLREMDLLQVQQQTDQRLIDYL